MRFAIRVDPLFRGLFAILGASPARDFVAVDALRVQVRLGWLFRADIARRALSGASLHRDVFGSWGAHGWRGRWLVNGSSRGIVEIDLDPAQRAYLLGVWPITLRVLFVSLEDPDGLLAALGH